MYTLTYIEGADGGGDGGGGGGGGGVVESLGVGITKAFPYPRSNPALASPTHKPR